MVFIRLGGEKVEGFYFHNNWKVQVDYGMNMTEIPFSDYNEIDESSLPSKDVYFLFILSLIIYVFISLFLYIRQKGKLFRDFLLY